MLRRSPSFAGRTARSRRRSRRQPGSARRPPARLCDARPDSRGQLGRRKEHDRQPERRYRSALAQFRPHRFDHGRSRASRRRRSRPTSRSRSTIWPSPSLAAADSRFQEPARDPDADVRHCPANPTHARALARRTDFPCGRRAVEQLAAQPLASETGAEPGRSGLPLAPPPERSAGRGELSVADRSQRFAITNAPILSPMSNFSSSSSTRPVHRRYAAFSSDSAGQRRGRGPIVAAFDQAFAIAATDLGLGSHKRCDDANRGQCSRARRAPHVRMTTKPTRSATASTGTDAVVAFAAPA